MLGAAFICHLPPCDPAGLFGSETGPHSWAKGSLLRLASPGHNSCPLGSTSRSPDEVAGFQSGVALPQRLALPPADRVACWGIPAAAGASEFPAQPVTDASLDPGSLAPAPAYCGPEGSPCGTAHRPQRSPSAEIPHGLGLAHHCPLLRSPHRSLRGRAHGAHRG